MKPDPSTPGWPSERRALLVSALALSCATFALAWADGRIDGAVSDLRPAAWRAGPGAAPVRTNQTPESVQAVPEGLAHATAATTTTSTALRASSLGAGPAADIESLVRRHALNALLVPVLDDDEHPARWADPSLSLPCGPATRVEVDHHPLQPHAEQPGTRFTLRWQLDHCVPFGAQGPVLTGIAELDVSRDDEGLSAIVRFDQLHAERHGHEVVMTQQFAARMP